MVREGVKQINLTISKETYDRIEKEWQPLQNEKKLSTYCLDTILLKQENDRWLSVAYPHITFMAVSGDIMMLKDSHLNDKIVGVKLRDCRFWCDTCTKSNCGHVYFTNGRLEKAKMVDSEPKLNKKVAKKSE